jgi:hypothetical protein
MPAGHMAAYVNLPARAPVGFRPEFGSSVPFCASHLLPQSINVRQPGHFAGLQAEPPTASSPGSLSTPFARRTT